LTSSHHSWSGCTTTAAHAIALDPATLDPATLDPATLDPATLDPATLDPATLDPATLDADGHAYGPFDALVEYLRGRLECNRTLRALFDVVSVDGLFMDRRRHVASIDHRELQLTLVEFRLLWTLARSPDRVFTRAQLSRACQTSYAQVEERNVDVHIRQLRQRLTPRNDLIGTVRGLGYCFCPGHTATCPRQLDPRATTDALTGAGNPGHGSLDVTGAKSSNTLDAAAAPLYLAGPTLTATRSVSKGV
jgi:DNA-binding winged helix-turn-helix (wHTH) protein